MIVQIQDINKLTMWSKQKKKKYLLRDSICYSNICKLDFYKSQNIALSRTLIINLIFHRIKIIRSEVFLNWFYYTTISLQIQKIFHLYLQIRQMRPMHFKWKLINKRWNLKSRSHTDLCTTILNTYTLGFISISIMLFHAPTSTLYLSAPYTKLPMKATKGKINV